MCFIVRKILSLNNLEWKTKNGAKKDKISSSTSEMDDQTDRGDGKIIIWGYVAGPYTLKWLCHAPNS